MSRIESIVFSLVKYNNYQMRQRVACKYNRRVYYVSEDAHTHRVYVNARTTKYSYCYPLRKRGL